MRLLVIAHYHEKVARARPSETTGVYAVVTENEEFLLLDGVEQRWTKFNDVRYSLIEKLFFSEYRAERWEMPPYINKCWQRIQRVLAVTDLKTIDKIIYCEVG